MSSSPLSSLGLPSPDDAEAAAGGNRKAVLGIAALLTAGLAVGAVLLLGGGDDLEGLGTTPAAVAAVPEPAASASPSPAPALRFPDADEVHDGRNPFEALYVEPKPEAVPVATGALTPAAPGEAVPAVPGAAVPVVPGEGTTVASRTLALLRTEGTDEARTAVFTLDGVEQSVAVGDSFGSSGTLLLLSLQQGPAAHAWTAVVQVGQGEPFDVVTGVPVTLP